MERDWAFEARYSRSWAATVMMLALGLVALGLGAAAWGLASLGDCSDLAAVIASLGGSVSIFVSGAAALIAFADLVRPPEPVVVVDQTGIFDCRVAPGPIPWSSIRRIRRAGTRLRLDVEGWGLQPGLIGRLFRRSRGAVVISLHGLTCAAPEVDAAIRHGLALQGRTA